MSRTVFAKVDTVWNLTRHYGFHFLSLVSIVVFMLIGFSPVLSVFWAIAVSFLASFLRADTAMISYDLFRGRGPAAPLLLRSPLVEALRTGSIGMLGVGATCAGAGIIVGVVTLTGLGLEIQRHRDRLCRGFAAADGDLHRLSGVGHRPGRAGHRVVHHLRGDRRAPR